MTPCHHPLSGLLGGTISAGQVSLADWDRVVRQARTARVLGILQARLEARDELDGIPDRVRWHLDSERRAGDKFQRDALWEVRQLRTTLDYIAQPLLLLKGAAYAVLDLPLLRGRPFSDIDLLVPRSRLDAIEELMRFNNWEVMDYDAYDQRYYREWMHELPPMRHRLRGTVVDIHHNLLPLTARLKPDAEKLLAAARPVAGLRDVFTLAPADMLLHSATHVFMDSEFDHGYRDLLDIDALIRTFGDGPFWRDLLARAEALDLLPPLWYALRFAQRFFATPVPAEISVACDRRWHPALPAVAGGLFGHALAPHHSSCRSMAGTVSTAALFVRGHYLRMPLRLLLPHLFRKACVVPVKEFMTRRQTATEPPVDAR